MFNVRNSTNTTRESVESFINENLKGLEYDFRTTQGSFPFVTNKESKVVKAMENSIQKVLNIKTKHSTHGGTSDARYFGSFGIEAIEFGVINDTIHSVGERTTVKEVEGLTADVVGGVITARGAQDMKSGDAAFLYACKHAQNFDGTLSILLTSDEEGEGTYGTIKMLEHLRDINFIPNDNINEVCREMGPKLKLEFVEKTVDIVTGKHL